MVPRLLHDDLTHSGTINVYASLNRAWIIMKMFSRINIYVGIVGICMWESASRPSLAATGDNVGDVQWRKCAAVHVA